MPGLLTRITPKRVWQVVILTISTVRLLPMLPIMLWCRGRPLIDADIRRWTSILLDDVNTVKNPVVSFIVLMTFFPEFRNLFYHRAGLPAQILGFLCPRMSTLFIHTKSIGEGLFIQHGFSTIISAASIGKHCWINQQVTIGYTNKTDCPVIEDNVTIGAGAKVLGRLTVGANARVGANAVVLRSVPPDSTVVGVPARIVRRNSVRVSEDL